MKDSRGVVWTVGEVGIDNDGWRWTIKEEDLEFEGLAIATREGRDEECVVALWCLKKEKEGDGE